MTQISTIRLFRGIHVTQIDKDKKTLHETTLKRTVKHGYVIDPHINPTTKLLNTIEESISVSGEST